MPSDTMIPSLEYTEETPAGFDANAELATDVLRSELGDAYSNEDENRMATAWELQHGRPLKRSFESWPQFRARSKKFDTKKSPEVDIQTAREELDRLLKIEVDDLDEEQKKRVTELIHGYEKRLSLPLTDFSKPRPKGPDAEKESLARFAAIAKAATWIDRVKLVQEERDLGALNLVAMRDEREEVRKAALRRIVSLSVTGR